MLSKQEEEQERRETLENDRLVLEQRRGSTLHQHGLAAANDTAGGRFAATGAAHVVGSTPTMQYPAAAAHQRDPVGVEPPLGIDINAMPESLDPSAVSMSFPAVEATGAPAAEVAPPSDCRSPPVAADGVEPRAGAPSFPDKRGE